jgi:serine O-acetyltransferase
LINSRKDYLFYLEADKAALGRRRPIKAFFDDIGRFQRILRKLEYQKNCGGKTNPFRLITLFRFRRQSRRLGFSIPPNVFGPGLKIMHRGPIVVTPNAQIGSNCKINICVQIGPGGNGGAPKIGDNCYIGPGAKIFGDIRIGDNVRIGANAVVNKSFPDGNGLLAGIPAKRISKGNAELLNNE